MSERLKYAINGICRIENFAECLENSSFPLERLSFICDAEWYCRLELRKGGTEIYLDTWCNSRFKHSIRTYSRLQNSLNENETRFEKTTSKILHRFKKSIGFSTPIREILNLENGWLDGDGALTYEYGIQVEAVMRYNFWEFNFYEKIFNAGAEMIEFREMNEQMCVDCFYAHSQLLKHQSQILENTVTVRGSREEVLMFGIVLQIAHGVQFKLKLNDLYGVLSMASKHGMRNVIHYCDVLLAQTIEDRRSFKGSDRYWIHHAIEYKLKRLMVQLLKPMKSVKDCIGEEDIEKMPNESMKMFLAKFLYEKF